MSAVGLVPIPQVRPTAQAGGTDGSGGCRGGGGAGGRHAAASAGAGTDRGGPRPGGDGPGGGGSTGQEPARNPTLPPAHCPGGPRVVREQPERDGSAARAVPGRLARLGMALPQAAAVPDSLAPAP